MLCLETEDADCSLGEWLVSGTIPTPQVEAAIKSEVARHLELSGSDFKRWPRAARDEVARLEKRLDAAQGLTGTLHAEVDAAAQQHQTDAVARAQLQV